MFLTGETLSFGMQIAAVVVPVAVYFLVLGLLNSRRHPQLLSGRQDFCLLMAALSPIFVLPVVHYAGVSLWSVFGSAAAVALAVALLAPRGRSWVIYNMPLDEAQEMISDALGATGLHPRRTANGIEIEDDDAFVEVGGFALLRNVSVRLRGGSGELARRIEAELSQRLRSAPAETSPMTTAMLLVATAMLVLPMTLVAQHIPELARILTNLLD